MGRLHEKQPTQNDMLSGSMASVYMNYEDSFQGTCKAYFVFETLYSKSEGPCFTVQGLKFPITRPFNAKSLLQVRPSRFKPRKIYGKMASLINVIRST